MVMNRNVSRISIGSKYQLLCDCSALSTLHILALVQYTCKVSVLILQMKKLNFRELMSLAQGHISVTSSLCYNTELPPTLM